MPLPEYKQLVDEAKREIKEIDPTELKRMQEQKQDFTLIDVREPDEVAEGAIAGAKPLPRGQLEHKIDTITTDKNEPIVCYCGGGGRSALAAQSLKKMGFKNVMSLVGGYKGWKGQLLAFGSWYLVFSIWQTLRAIQIFEASYSNAIDS
jgi:sulfur-carrier protein adenylyltransferase/sulfurtransferase